MKISLALVFVLIFVSSVYAACDYATRGKHGISIEGTCYDCDNSVSDGICPKDFFTDASWICNDKDCPVITKCDVGTSCTTLLGCAGKYNSDCACVDIAGDNCPIGARCEVGDGCETEEGCAGKYNSDCACVDVAGDSCPTTACTTCEELDGDLTCNSKKCGTIQCYLGENILGIDKCYDCSSSVKCSGYNNDGSSTCESDPCGLNCEWKDDKCAEKVVTAKCGDGIVNWEDGEECDFDSNGAEILPIDPGTDKPYTCGDFDFGTGSLHCFAKTSNFACKLDITDCSDVTAGPGECGDEKINVDEATDTYEECDCGTNQCSTDLGCEDFEFGEGVVECVDCELDFESSCGEDYTGLSCVNVEKCEDYDILSCEEDPCSAKTGTTDNVDDLYAGELSEGDEICTVACISEEDDVCLEEKCASCYICQVGEDIGCTDNKEECDTAKENEDASPCDCETEEGMVLCAEIGFICLETIGGDGVTDEEPAQPFPIFTWFNLIITSVIIIGFYVFIHKKK